MQAETRDRPQKMKTTQDEIFSFAVFWLLNPHRTESCHFTHLRCHMTETRDEKSSCKVRGEILKRIEPHSGRKRDKTPNPCIAVLHCSVTKSRPHGLQHTMLPCPSPTPRAYSNTCPSSQWCHPTTSSSVVPFSSCLQSFPASGSFPVSQFFASGDQSIGVSASASVLPMNIQGWFPLRMTGLLSLQGD